MTYFDKDPDAPAEEMSLEEKNSLLRYAGSIAVDKGDSKEVLRIALELATIIMKDYPTWGQQQAIFMAMMQQGFNRPGTNNPYRDAQEFMDEAGILYKALRPFD